MISVEETNGLMGVHFRTFSRGKGKNNFAEKYSTSREETLTMSWI